jgi:hypothetical protein
MLRGMSRGLGVCELHNAFLRGIRGKQLGESFALTPMQSNGRAKFSQLILALLNRLDKPMRQEKAEVAAVFLD